MKLFCRTYFVVGKPFYVRDRLTGVTDAHDTAAEATRIVRDEIIKYMEGQDDLEECRKYIISHLDDIARKADNVIKAEGFDYESTAELGVFYIPRKSYEDLTLPAGNYEALRIILGEGQGQNWWCVIFPNLCLIDVDSEDASSSDRLIIKSKIKEKIRNISCSHHIY